MQDVFSKNPKMGDPTSLAPQLDENSRTLDQLQQEIRKYEVRCCRISFSRTDWFVLQLIANYVRSPMKNFLGIAAKSFCWQDFHVIPLIVITIFHKNS